MFKIIKAAPTYFGLHKPSSGSHSQCVAKIAMLVPVYVCISWTNKEFDIINAQYNHEDH
jgi:hypothetical protein